MKAFLVTVTFKDGQKEGVMFTDEGDAKMALRGEELDGSALACAWCDLYGDNDAVEMTELEI